MTVRQKLDMILENKVVQKSKLENNVFLQNILNWYFWHSLTDFFSF